MLGSELLVDISRVEQKKRLFFAFYIYLFWKFVVGEMHVIC